MLHGPKLNNKTKTRKVYMKFQNRFLKALLTVMTLAFSQVSVAGLITGPTLTNNNSGWSNNGLSLTALQDTTLLSFVYNNQGLADTILLVDELGNILDTFNVLGGDTAQVINVSWSLDGGSTYGLLATQEFGNNGRWVNATFPVSNADISVNGYANGGLGTVAGTEWWFHFTNLTTGESVDVPEPSSFAILALGMLGLASRRFKK